MPDVLYNEVRNTYAVQSSSTLKPLRGQDLVVWPGGGRAEEKNMLLNFAR